MVHSIRIVKESLLMRHFLRCGQGVGKEAPKTAQNSPAEGMRVLVSPDPDKKELVEKVPCKVLLMREQEAV